MATDLFGKYFNNPTKSEIYTTLTCNGSSADDMSFDITGSEGVISDNANTLASIDLSDVHVGMTQYTSDMKIIEPYSYVYIKGMSFGETLMSKSYGQLPESFTDTDGWEYNIATMFAIKYTQDGKTITKSVKIESDSTIDLNFIDAINQYFENNNINITCSYNDNYITFDSTVVGYEFWIDHFIVLHNNTTNNILQGLNTYISENGFAELITWSDSDTTPHYEYTIKTENDISKFCQMMKGFNGELLEYLNNNGIEKCHIFEDLSKYIGVRKYRNGAMKGIVLKATYPEFNAESIYEYQEALKLVHLIDRVERYTPIDSELEEGKYIAYRDLVDVVDTYQPIYDSFRSTCECTCGHCDDKTQENDIIYTSLKNGNVIGIEGFCKYATDHNLWATIGQLYIRTSVSDDPTIPECRNLIPSFVLHNPNPFPVIVKYLAFV